MRNERIGLLQLKAELAAVIQREAYSVLEIDAPRLGATCSLYRPTNLIRFTENGVM